MDPVGRNQEQAVDLPQGQASRDPPEQRPRSERSLQESLEESGRDEYVVSNPGVKTSIRRQFCYGFAFIALFPVVPLFLGVTLGGILSLVERHPFIDGFLYVTSNVLSFSNSLTEFNPDEISGIIVDIYVSVTALLFLGIVINIVQIFGLATKLNKFLRKRLPEKGHKILIPCVALLVVIPLTVVAIAVSFGGLLALAENWHYYDGVRYILSNILGLATPLTDVLPTSLGGDVLDIYISSMALACTAFFIDYVTTVNPSTYIKEQVRRLLHKQEQRRQTMLLRKSTPLVEQVSKKTRNKSEETLDIEDFEPQEDNSFQGNKQHGSSDRMHEMASRVLVGTCFILLFPLVPALLGIVMGGLLAWIEGVAFMKGFLYVVSNILNFSNPLTDFNPVNTAGITVDIYVSITSLLFLGIAVNVVRVFHLPELFNATLGKRLPEKGKKIWLSCLVFLVVIPVAVALVSVIFGALLAAAESWNIHDGIRYVFSNLLGLATPLTEILPTTVGGDIIDVYISSLAMGCVVIGFDYVTVVNPARYIRKRLEEMFEKKSENDASSEGTDAQGDSMAELGRDGPSSDVETGGSYSFVLGDLVCCQKRHEDESDC